MRTSRPRAMTVVTGFILVAALTPPFTSARAADALKIRVENWGVERETPSVEDDTKNLRIEKRPKDQRERPKPQFPLGKALESKGAPMGSVAARVFDAKSVYHWRPNWFFIGAGQTRLPIAVLSDDQSVLAIVETLGARDGPYASRIVFVDTYRWIVSRVVQLKKRHVTRMVFGAPPASLICWCERQPSLRRPSELVVVNGRDGSITSSDAVADVKISSMILDAKNKRLLLKSADAGTVGRLSLDDVTAKPDMFRVGVNGGPIAVSPDGSRLAMGGEGVVKMVSLDDFKPVSEVKLDWASPVRKIVFADANDRMALLLESDRVVFLKNRFQTTLTDMGAGPLRYEKERNTLVVGELKNDEIKFVPTPDLTPVTSAFPSKLRPRTRGAVAFIAYLNHLDKYLILDDNGNLYVIYKPGRRWKKHLLFSAMK